MFKTYCFSNGTVFKTYCNSTVLIQCSKTTILECWNAVFKNYCNSKRCDPYPHGSTFQVRAQNSIVYIEYYKVVLPLETGLESFYY